MPRAQGEPRRLAHPIAGPAHTRASWPTLGGQVADGGRSRWPPLDWFRLPPTISRYSGAAGESSSSSVVEPST